MSQDNTTSEEIPELDKSLSPQKAGKLVPDASTPGGSSGPADIKEIALPQEAADSDLIEKEWVERAKEIVDHTRDDPYEQQKALAQMKAEYMKKRYNKDVKAE